MKNDQKSSKNAFFLINFAKNVKNDIENKHFFADITKLSWSEEMSFMYVLYLSGRHTSVLRSNLSRYGVKNMIVQKPHRYPRLLSGSY